MNIFETHLYDEQKGVWFADTLTMLRGKGFGGTDLSYAREDIIATGNESLLAYDLVYLERLFEHGHDLSLAPSIRNKYLTTWEIYRQKYRGLCTALERAGFKFEEVIQLDWRPFVAKIGTEKGFFG